MYTLRLSVLAFVLLAGSALSASAQLQSGSTLYFDHPQADALDTAKYQLCQDGVADATCADLAVLKVATVGTVDSFSFTLPGTVARGNHVLQVRAVGFGDTGASGGSNALAVRVIGKPGPPVLLRLQQAVTP